MSSYYKKEYFDWQKNIGKFGGRANLFKFKEYISKSDKVVDYGCGGGYLLNNINCKSKVGIEVNKEAIKVARKNGIIVYTNAQKINNEWADIIISNHTLEHVNNPFNQLKILHKKLIKGGLIIFVVPCELIGVAYKKDDINQHIYSWSPGALGNLFSHAGFSVLSSKPIFHKWPPFYLTLHRIFGEKLFHIFCRLYGRINTHIVQVKVVAKK